MIVSFLKRLNANNNQKQTTQKTSRNTHTKIEKKDQSTVAPSRKERLPKQSRLEQQYAEVKKGTELSKPSVSSESPRVRHETYINQKEIPEKNTINGQKDDVAPFSPSNKDIIDGVIWSEILGPPRALHPHTSRRRGVKR